MKKSGRRGTLCRLNIEKRYNHFSWNFLGFILEKMEFVCNHLKWTNWIFFLSSKDLSQGDCIIPFYFDNGSLCLDHILEILGGSLEGWKIGQGGRGCQEVSHLLLANDTLIFGNAKEKHVTHLTWILMWVENTSGSKLDLH